MQKDLIERPVVKNELAAYFCVDDLIGAHIPATRLTGILEKIQQDRPLSQYSLAYLERNGLVALMKHLADKTKYSEFKAEAKAEQTQRQKQIEVIRIAKEAEEKQRELDRQARMKLDQERAIAARIVLEQDPKYIAKIKNQKLRERYGLDYFIEKECFENVMHILKCLEAGHRLTEKDIIWISTTENGEYFTIELREAYHLLEAKYYESQFKTSQDPWMAISASSHYRKANHAEFAERLLSTIDIVNKKSAKLKSAFFTTWGGVKRDLGKKDQAISFGEKAHGLMEKDFRPCTLIGAVYMEDGQVILGHEWYSKAAERGATEQSIDRELRSIFMRADKTNQAAMRKHLLRIDPNRYNWINKIGRKR